MKIENLTILRLLTPTRVLAIHNILKKNRISHCSYDGTHKYVQRETQGSWTTPITSLKSLNTHFPYKSTTLFLRKGRRQLLLLGHLQIYWITLTRRYLYLKMLRHPLTQSQNWIHFPIGVQLGHSQGQTKIVCV